MAVDRAHEQSAERRPAGRERTAAGRPPPAGRAAAVARLQRKAGNAAVARLVAPQARAETPAAPAVAEVHEALAPAPFGLVQRQVACPAEPPAAPSEPRPDEDPRFQAVKGGVEGESAKLKQHPKAADEAKKAQAAAEPPANDKESQAKAAQADKMAGAKPGGFDKAAFMAAVRKAIEAASPKNLDEADKFASSGKAAAVKGEVMGKVTAGKDAAAGDVKATTTAPPDASKAKEKPVAPLAEAPPPKTPADPGAAKAMPEPAPPEQTNLDADRCETKGQMAEAGVTDKQLAQSNEPQFEGALAAKKEGEQHSATAPAEVRGHEQKVLESTAADAQATAKAGLEGMAAEKKAGQEQVKGEKTQTKAKDEEERKRVASEIDAIYTKTKTETEAILNALDGKVAAEFDKGEADARAAFEDTHKREMEAWKEKRYSGVAGWGRWIADKFRDPPPEANAIYERARKLYVDRMEGVISKVADIVGAELTRAKERIAQGRAEIKAYVALQKGSLRKFAQEAQSSIADKFDALEQDVDSKQESLVQDLAQKYVEARNAVDERIKAMQEENKGLWSKAKDAVGGAIQIILQLKDALMGVLAKAAAHVSKIIGAPIAFLGNLVGAVKSGLQKFVGNIAEHLKGALQKWLLGSLADAGLELPEKFDLKGILHLILQILGLTWANIRAKLVKAFGKAGEKIMGALEKGFSLVQILVKEGPIGLWKLIVEKISDLKEQVLGKIKEFVITKIVIAGITWLVGLLNPAAAFIKACKAIIDIVRFLFERGQEIMEFVNTVVDSIGAIASGAIGGAASAIENVLKRILPLLLGFLASLLGLGGISTKIREFIEIPRKPVSKVLNAVISKIVKVGKKLWRKLKAKLKRKVKKDKKKTPSAKVKGDALAAVLSRARGKPRISDFHAVVADVRANFRKQGLKDLRVQIKDASSLTIAIRAKASPEDERTMRWEEAFSPEEHPAPVLEKLRKRFAKEHEPGASPRERQAVWAAVTVNGRMIGREERDNSKTEHAEDVVLDQHWHSALSEAKLEVQGSPTAKAKVVFAISASPCPKCTSRLHTEIGSAKSKLGKYRSRVSFVLAPVSAYEGKEKKPKKGEKAKGPMAEATKAKGMEALMEAGWDLRQLMARPRGGLRSYWDVPLAEWFKKLADRFESQKK